MSDDLPIPPPPPKGSDLPTPPELIENRISSDEPEESFEDIKNSIDNILSEVSEIPVSYTHLTLPTIYSV